MPSNSAEALKESYAELVRVEKFAEAALKKVDALLAIQAQLEKDMDMLVRILGSTAMQKFNSKTVVTGRTKVAEVEKSLLSLKNMMGYFLTGIEDGIEQAEKDEDNEKDNKVKEARKATTQKRFQLSLQHMMEG